MRTAFLWVLGLALVGLEVWWLAAPWGGAPSPGHAPSSGAPSVPLPTLAPHPVGRPTAGRDAVPPGTGRAALPAASGADAVQGRVEDALGRPIEGAAVYALDGAGISAEAATDANGRFTIPVSGEGLGVADRIAAVARGSLATVVALHPDHRSNLSLRLTSDAAHGQLEITLVDDNGSPVADARVWVAPPGSARPAVAQPPPADDALALTRRLRARLEQANDLADQEFEVGQGCWGVGALRPDAAGRIRVAALLPGPYRVVAATRIVSDGRDLPPDETLMISAYCTDGHTSSAEACVDAVIDVAPPPATTARRLVLRRARAFEGRIVVDRNPAWGAEAQHWRHIVEVEGCPLPRAEVESGAWSFAGTTNAFSGRFRLGGLPRTACRLVVSTGGAGSYPNATCDLPAVSDAAPDDADARDIHVADGRTLSGAITWSDGSPLAQPADIRIEGYAGTAMWSVVEVAAPGSKGSDARYGALLDRPLLGSEIAVVRIANDPTREYKLPLARYDRDHPETLRQDLVIPAPPPPPSDGVTETK